MSRVESIQFFVRAPHSEVSILSALQTATSIVTESLVCPVNGAEEFCQLIYYGRKV
jgi:hypothetical protein